MKLLNFEAQSMLGEYVVRLWNFLSDCIRMKLSGAEKQAAKEEALRLSLKFNFVTPLTSMVVTKPQGEETDVLHKPKEGKAPVPDGARQRFYTPTFLQHGGCRLTQTLYFYSV